MESERVLRDELAALAKKRAQLDAAARSGAGGGQARRNLLSRVGGPARGVDASRVAGKRRDPPTLKESTARMNAGRRHVDRRDDDRAAKRQRLQPAPTRTDREKTDREKSDPVESNERVEQLKKRAVAPYTQMDGIARSRRMFGALMGHLGRAKKDIEKDTDLLKRQGSMLQEAEEKERQQNEELATKARRNTAVKKLETLVAKTEVDRQEAITRKKLEHLQNAKKSENLTKFLQTTASPPLLYLPAKHTKETEDLLQASVEAQKEKQKTAAREFEVQMREIEAEYQSKLDTLREQLKEAKEEQDKADIKKKTDNKAGKDSDVDEQQVRKVERKQSDAADSVMSEEHDTQAESGSIVPVKEETDEAMEEAKVSHFDADESVKASNGNENDEEMQEEQVGEVVEELKEAVEAKAEGERVADAEKLEPMTDTVDDEETEKKDPDVAAGPGADNKDAAEAEGTEKADEAEAEEAEDSGNTEEAEPEVMDVSKLRVPELREELKKRGLDTKGLKAKLVARLEEALAAQA